MSLEFLSAVFVGRRWFNRSKGHSYNTCEIFIDGRLVHKTPIDGGYGDQYLHIGRQWLKENGYIPGFDGSWYKYCRDNGITSANTVVDVTRQKDL